MKTLGLIGGMSWESSLLYYQIINTLVKEQLGGLHSAKIILYSVDFAEIEACQAQENWAQSAIILSNAAQALQAVGADIIVICTNTMHKVAPDIAQSISIPMLHMATAIADVLKKQNIRKVGLLGTKYTMEQDFLKGILIEKGIDVLIPHENERQDVNHIIYDELCCGIIKESSKAVYTKIIAALHARGAEGVILGCTEIGMLVQQHDVGVPLFDTTRIHATAAALWALGKKQ